MRASATTGGRAAALPDPANLQPGAGQPADQLGQLHRPDRVGGGHRRPFRLGERRALLDGEGEPPAGAEGCGDLAQQRLLVPEREHRLEQQDDVERPARDRRDLADRELTRQSGGSPAVAREPRWPRRPGRRRGSCNPVSAVTSRPGPATPQQRSSTESSRSDPCSPGQATGSRRPHEALLPNVLARRVRRLPAASHGLVVARPLVHRRRDDSPTRLALAGSLGGLDGSVAPQPPDVRARTTRPA